MDESATQPPWMDDAASVSSDLHLAEPTTCDEMQQHRAFVSDIEAIRAFLDEIEPLYKDSTGTIKSELARQNADEPPVKAVKKKLSTTERQKREKAKLLESLEQLQLQIQDVKIKQQHQAQRTQEHLKHERSEAQRALDENLEILDALAREESRASRLAATLLQQSRGPLKAFASPICKDDTTQDAAIFESLKLKVNDSYMDLTHKWENGYIPMATEEMMDTVLSADGIAMTCSSALFYPFEAQAISDSVWRVACSGFEIGSVKKITRLDPDQIAVKEQVMIYPAGQNAVQLCLHAVVKRSIHESSSVCLWEVACNWSTPSSAWTSSTQESGWVLIRPAHSHGAVSVTQSQMKMTLVESSMNWMQLKHHFGVMLPVIVPSTRQVMQQRIQRVENDLIDAAMQINLPSDLSLPKTT